LAILKNPVILKDLLSKEDYNSLLVSIGNPKRFSYDPAFGRYTASDGSIIGLREMSDKLLPIARKTFQSETLLSTYTIFAHYEGDASLLKHKDDNACTYTLDLCLYQAEPWGLFVDGKEYILNPNEALAYYGNDQEHWREDFPNKEKNFVAMIFFHYAEPHHWFFTKGPNYLEVIINKKTEVEWEKENDISSTI
jgi:hypothetical protein